MCISAKNLPLHLWKPTGRRTTVTAPPRPLKNAGNRIQVRRNQADLLDDEEDFAVAPDKKEKRAGRRRLLSGRKMIRRGMEMLVGGVPINADPTH